MSTACANANVELVKSEASEKIKAEMEKVVKSIEEIRREVVKGKPDKGVVAKAVDYIKKSIAPSFIVAVIMKLLSKLPVPVL